MANFPETVLNLQAPEFEDSILSVFHPDDSYAYAGQFSPRPAYDAQRRAPGISATRASREDPFPVPGVHATRSTMDGRAIILCSPGRSKGRPAKLPYLASHAGGEWPAGPPPLEGISLAGVSIAQEVCRIRPGTRSKKQSLRPPMQIRLQQRS